MPWDGAGRHHHSVSPRCLRTAKGDCAHDEFLFKMVMLETQGLLQWQWFSGCAIKQPAWKLPQLAHQAQLAGLQWQPPQGSISPRLVLPVLAQQAP